MPSTLTACRDILRIISGTFTAETIDKLSRRHAMIGILATWLVGIGRYWDAPRASLAQYLGLGSLCYVVVLSTLLWLIVAPIHPHRWQWRKVFIFTTCTAPPAALYAIPVERFLHLDTAITINIYFLAIVAVWRVILYALLLHRYAQLNAGRLIVGLFCPLALIVTTLA
ncbi:MAG: hypothetical protein ACYTF0_04165, partial [Planctomycetota bacterium]